MAKLLKDFVYNRDLTGKNGIFVLWVIHQKNVVYSNS